MQLDPRACASVERGGILEVPPWTGEQILPATGKPRATAAMDATHPLAETPASDLTEAIRSWFRDDPSRMTMMAARKFSVPERQVVEALVGLWPIVRLRDGVFRELMDA